MNERKERDCVRQLAARVAEIAHEPRMEAITRRWRDVNALRKPDRAPVWCRPVGCWNEIIPEDALVPEYSLGYKRSVWHYNTGLAAAQPTGVRFLRGKAVIPCLNI